MATFDLKVSVVRAAIEDAFRNLSRRNPLFTAHTEWHHLLGDGHSDDHDGRVLATERTDIDGDPPAFWLDMPGTRIEYRIILTTPWRDHRDRPARPAADTNTLPEPGPNGG